MTKEQHLAELKYTLKKLDYANHPAIIEAAFNDVYNQIIADLPPAQLKDFEYITKNYEVAIAKDTGVSDRYYSELPVSIISLPRPTKGVIAINSTDGTAFRYYPITERESRLTSNLESGLYDRYWGYYLQGLDKVFYTRMTATLASAGVRMLLAPQFRDFASTDEVPLPDNRDYSIKQLVIDYIRQTQVLDLQIEKND